ncbi:MmcQ/YjbR family DNA-binding protein [Actinobacillus equuli]|uniref:MmcQ/YjbR family DNA-binding protein n=1 Tax=Actinobacillus equuli TaxID=718 RepID=UPI0024428393|nr:MmcQ/YjbR family DNA-binding protein [Actinobacillus equuli]WGE53820.1 MmcQ/YjbR family DNA-binding protein [Actinobacillus equuli subsp. haemolyticus]WGE74259.1 MmcQ/YjbR family DNA-binding protein [Actinobacillus equuli subsp. haemolyticus]
MQNKKLNFRDEVLLYVLQQYGTEPEFLWKKHPTYAVLRHPDNRKWYAILMDVASSVFGLSGEKNVPVMNVKCSPDLLNSFLPQPGFFPAYHMNKANWLSILLDGSVDKETILFLLNSSFDLTATRQRKQKLGIASHTEWIVPANPKYYDVEQALEVGAELLWKQSNNIALGDMVYIYVTAPTAAIRCKCEALEVNLPYKSERTDLRIEKVMRLKCLNVYHKELLPKNLLQSFGVSAVRGPRKMPFALSEEINRIAIVLEK